MDISSIPIIDEMTPLQFENFINECVEDLQKGEFLDFDEVFDELEKRYL